MQFRNQPQTLADVQPGELHVGIPCCDVEGDLLGVDPVDGRDVTLEFVAEVGEPARILCCAGLNGLCPTGVALIQEHYGTWFPQSCQRWLRSYEPTVCLRNRLPASRSCPTVPDTKLLFRRLRLTSIKVVRDGQ